MASTLTSTPLLNGKRVLITGGARGLGKEFAEAVAGAGASVVIADILEEPGSATAAELMVKGLKVKFVGLDLADEDSIQRCVKESAQWLGGIDGLVNNGAVATGIGGKTFEEMDSATWDRVMSVNVRGTWQMTKYAAPYLRTSRGRVINVASDTALWGAPNLLPYVASKGAVIAMTRSLARELGEHGVTVNAIAPGLTMVEATEYVPAARHQMYVEGRALSRAQYPADICGAVVFFLSDASAFITGQLLAVNGGFLMH
jgi:NAD(P)-dependent dehydrogenase (short-subunit alcohol dehydrogenase family)